MDNFINRFHKVDQSARPTSILGAPFTVETTCICYKELLQEYGGGKRNFNGHGRKRKNLEVNYATFDDGLIIIRNHEDRFCLFHAVEMARMEKTSQTSQKFRDYRKSYRRQLRQVLGLMRSIGAPENLRSYNAAEWLPLVQQYYDQIFPGMFSIYVFGKYGTYRPILKYGHRDNLHQLVLYHNDEKFDVIPKVNRFFQILKTIALHVKPLIKTDIHIGNDVSSYAATVEVFQILLSLLFNLQMHFLTCNKK